MVSQEDLSRDLARLRRSLDEVLGEQGGPELLALTAELQRLAASRTAGDQAELEQLAARLAALEPAETRFLARAHAIGFDLANLAEDRHRVRVLRAREAAAHPEPREESIAAAIAELHAAGLGPDELQQVLNRLSIEPVFTAHPTEAKRRSGRVRLRRVREHLASLSDPGLLPRERHRTLELLAADLTATWQTDLLRWRRPTVLEEVATGLYFARTLWEVVPALLRDLREALAQCYPDHTFRVPSFLRFGSWIGGDRDGNPNVTAETTLTTLRRHREAALELHLEQARAMTTALTSSDRQVPVSDELRRALAANLDRFRGARQQVASISPHEVYRRWFRVIEWRLERTSQSDPFSDPLVGAYLDAEALERDLKLAADSLQRHGGERIVEGELAEWLQRAQVFGFHLCRLDVRQEAGWLRAAMADILAALGHPGYDDLPEAERLAVLTETLGCRDPIPEDGLGSEAREALALCAALADVSDTLGQIALGGFVISLTTTPSDVLLVLWLLTWAGLAGLRARVSLPIVPLFESISVLGGATEILGVLYDHRPYRTELERWGRVQMVMVGYSDSSKDGGYLAANWALYRAQDEVHRQAVRHDLRVIFFHGRGGSLGRGGGPAAHSILSLPPHSVDGGLRLTEQGEVLAERYDDPAIAYRHLEQLSWGMLLVSGEPAPAPEPTWTGIAEELADLAFKCYRELVEDPGFVAYFRGATPIRAIEMLPIGSRPSRRRGRSTLADLRAIPWVFAWTQSRQMLPAWYGTGSALQAFAADRGWDELRLMYQRWSFFRILLDDAALALLKTDLSIAERYAALVEPEIRQPTLARILAEHQRTSEAILAVTGEPRLLDHVGWLHEEIRLRNPLVDVLNLIQIETLQRMAALPETADTALRDQLDEIVRLTIGGVASGLRTTG